MLGHPHLAEFILLGAALAWSNQQNESERWDGAAESRWEGCKEQHPTLPKVGRKLLPQLGINWGRFGVCSRGGKARLSISVIFILGHGYC